MAYVLREPPASRFKRDSRPGSIPDLVSLTFRPAIFRSGVRVRCPLLFFLLCRAAVLHSDSLTAASNEDVGDRRFRGAVYLCVKRQGNCPNAPSFLDRLRVAVSIAVSPLDLQLVADR